MPRAKPDPVYVEKLKAFYADFLENENYKQTRFHDLAKRKGLPAVLVSHALQHNKAPVVFTFINLTSQGAAFGAADVKDDNNFTFLLGLMSAIGPVVPTTSSPEKALQEVAKFYKLHLGDGATESELEAWASREADLHRGLMQYALRRTNKNPKSRSHDAKMNTLKNLVKALRSEMPPELLRKRSRSKTMTPRSQKKCRTGGGGSSGSKPKGASGGSTGSGANMDLRDPRFPTDDGTAETDADDDGSSSTAPGGHEGERDPEEESLTHDECISDPEPVDPATDKHPLDEPESQKDRKFPVRSVPDALEKAAAQVLEELEGEGGDTRVDLMEMQKKYRAAAKAFEPVQGKMPPDAPLDKPKKGKGKGKGKRSKEKEKEKEQNKGEGSVESEDADLDEEDKEIERELSDQEKDGKDTPKIKDKKKDVRKTPKKTPMRRKKRTPKLKRAYAASREAAEGPDQLEKDHLQVITRFREEVAELGDARLIVPKDLSLIKSFTLAPLTAKGPSIGVLFVTRSFFVGPVTQSHVDEVTLRMGGPKVKVNPSRRSITLSWAKHGGLKATWQKACAMAGWDPLAPAEG